MATLSLIVAIDQKNAIGKGNKMLTHLPDDLKYFQKVTTEHTVIMGRKTFESLPKGALPNRRNIVISKNEDLELKDCEVVHSLDEAIAMTMAEEEVFILGGGMIYKEALEWADSLYITEIHHTFDEAEVYFPEFDEADWQEVWREDHQADEKHKYAFSFVKYDKI